MEAYCLTNECGERIGVLPGIGEYERLRQAADEAAIMKRYPGLNIQTIEHGSEAGAPQAP
jgi:hypothetical protein